MRKRLFVNKLPLIGDDFSCLETGGAFLLPSSAGFLPKVLLVDDDPAFRDTVDLILKSSGFDVVMASGVNDALKLIASETFDILLSDLHMPYAGDGLTVVSAMRHANPKAATFILSAYPEMKQAVAAILRQTDGVLTKPIAANKLVKTIRERLNRDIAPEPRPVEDLTTILERETQSTIQDWLNYVDLNPLLLTVPLDDDERCAHLPQLFRELVAHMRNPPPLGGFTPATPAAAEHGRHRHQQGYTAAMLIEESRLLRVSIFQTIENNLHRVDFSKLLLDIMSVDDEVDSQLAQQMNGYFSDTLERNGRSA